MSPSAAAPTGTLSLRTTWELRNAASETLIKVEQQMRQLLEAADVEQLVSLLEAFSPARSPGPEWTRSFDALIERLWAWCDTSTLSAVAADFQARGPAWTAVTNALAPERGEEMRARLSRGSGAARLPLFTLG
jgi:hypothetical protein